MIASLTSAVGHVSAALAVFEAFLLHKMFYTFKKTNYLYSHNAFMKFPSLPAFPARVNVVTRLFAVLFVFFMMIAPGELHAQSSTRDIPQSQMFRPAEGMVRIAEPGQRADTLNVWGDVSLPGRYIVPKGTNLADFISYARGPVRLQTRETQIDFSKIRLEINVSRFDPDEGEQVINIEYSYRDPIPEEFRTYILQNNDLVSVQVRRRPIFIDYVNIIAPVVSLILSTLLLYDRVR